jgi:hypothetical protein
MVSDQSSNRNRQDLQAELDRLLEQQRQIMDLLSCQSPDRILHDLRNVLNELTLLRALAVKEG